MKTLVDRGRSPAVGRWQSVAGAALLLPIAATAAAQPTDGDAVSASVTAGVGIAPDYEGSDDYQIVPLVAARAEWRGLSLETNGIGLQADLVPLPQLSLGPIVRYAPGRDDVDDALVDRLAEVDSGVEVGGHIGLSQRDPLGAGGVASLDLEIVAEVADGHGGMTAEVSAGWAVPLTGDLRLATSVSGTWASDEYMESFFGIDAAGAAASGLRTFQADSGIKDVGFGATLSYAFTESFSAVGIFGYTRLLGDAADSPVTDDRGSPDQLFGGLGLSYRF